MASSNKFLDINQPGIECSRALNSPGFDFSAMNNNPGTSGDESLNSVISTYLGNLGINNIGNYGGGGGRSADDRLERNFEGLKDLVGAQAANWATGHQGGGRSIK